MININSIDDSLNEKSEQIIKVADRLVFNEICEFKPKTADKDIPWNDIVYSGVYLIEVQTD